MSASVHITKFAAAQRQLRAAIRMFFVEEDELAIHTVASAAYRLLVDLKKDRGMDEAADAHLTSLFYAVRSYKRGTLPTHITSSPEVMAQIAEPTNIRAIPVPGPVPTSQPKVGANQPSTCIAGSSNRSASIPPER